MTVQEKKKTKIRILIVAIIATVILAGIFLRLVIVEPNTTNFKGSTTVNMELK